MSPDRPGLPPGWDFQDCYAGRGTKAEHDNLSELRSQTLELGEAEVAGIYRAELEKKELSEERAPGIRREPP